MKQKILKYKIESFFILAAIVISIAGITTYSLAINVSRNYAVSIRENGNIREFYVWPTSTNVVLINFSLTAQRLRGAATNTPEIATNTPVILNSFSLTNTGTSAQNPYSPLVRYYLYEGNNRIAVSAARQGRAKFLFRNLNLSFPSYRTRYFTVKGDLNRARGNNGLQNGQTISLGINNTSDINAIGPDRIRANILPPGRIPAALNIRGNTLIVIRR